MLQGKEYSKAARERLTVPVFASHLSHGDILVQPVPPSLAMHEFLIWTRDASLPNSLHKGQGLTVIPETVDQPKGWGGREMEIHHHKE